jgi:two-component system, OmpR family, heavy metal sensor histidine kinase CusS
MSIRVRLILWHSTVFAVSLLGFAVVVWLATRAAVGNDIDTWLTFQADGLARFIQEETHGTTEAAVIEEAREFSSGLPKGSGIQLFDQSGRLLLSRPDAAVGLVAAQPSTFTSDQSRLRALSGHVTIGDQEYQFTLWRSLDLTEAALGDLRMVLMLMVPGLLLISIAGGWLLSRHALKPIDDVTEAARRISLQDLSRSLPVPNHGDELQRLCEAWNEMLRRLDDSARQLRQFTADASHELRTPVTLIRTTAELTLRKERTPELYQEALRGIQKDAEKLTELVQNLMDLARADAGQSKFVFNRLDLRELVSEVQRQAESIAAQNNLTLDVDLPPSELPVLGDRGALRRLLLVLLENASKFTPAPGRVSMRAKGIPGEVVLEVQDTGVGIPDQDLPRIFDRFYQADDSRSGGGMGLGLSIAQWIVQGHNARIEVQSSVGSGSIFRVFFPGA